MQHGNMTVTPTAEHFTPEEQRGVFATNHSVIHTSRSTELSWEGPADFAQIIDFLRMAVGGNNGANCNFWRTYRWQPCGSTGRLLAVHPQVWHSLWEFMPNNSSSNKHDSYTIEHGDNKMVARIPYCMATEFGFSGGISEVVNLSVSMFGREMILRVDEDTATASGADAISTLTLVHPTRGSKLLTTLTTLMTLGLFSGNYGSTRNDVLDDAEIMVMSKSKVFIDDTWSERWGQLRLQACVTRLGVHFPNRSGNVQDC